MEGRFLNEPTVAALGAAITQAAVDGIDVVFLTTGPLGDAITLSAGLGTIPTTHPILLGIRTNLSTQPHRHPTVLARDMTALDLVTRGRTLLAFTPPFNDGVGEAIEICRAMWRQGVVATEGPHYPVPGAINRPRPAQQPDGPRLALDLTDGTPAPPALIAAADLILVRAGAATADRPALPAGTPLCQIHLM